MSTPTNPTNVYLAKFSGGDIDYPIENKDVLSQGVEIAVDMLTTASEVKKVIFEASGIPLDHLSLKIYHGTKAIKKGKDTTYSCGPTFYLKDSQTIKEAMRPLSPIYSEEESSLTSYGEPNLLFSAARCTDPSHCSDMVKVKRLFKDSIFRIPFTNEMTGSQLKERIAAKMGLDAPFNLQHETFLISDETTMETAKVKHNSTIQVLNRTKPV